LSRARLTPNDAPLVHSFCVSTRSGPFAAFETKVRYSDTIAALKRWVPDAAVRRIIGGETALKFYFT